MDIWIDIGTRAGHGLIYSSMLALRTEFNLKLLLPKYCGRLICFQIVRNSRKVDSSLKPFYKYDTDHKILEMIFDRLEEDLRRLCNFYL